jgi:hypothetical protein
MNRNRPQKGVAHLSLTGKQLATVCKLLSSVADAQCDLFVSYIGVLEHFDMEVDAETLK